MNFENVKVIVARKAGLNLAQNKTVVETAILGALEEIGVHYTIADAIKDRTETIAASASYITWMTEYSRFISVVYRFASGGSNYDRPLTKASPTEFAYKNRGKQGETTDYLTHYCPKGTRIYVAPGSAKTGGSIIVSYQRKLMPEDIEKLPDANMLIWGGLANLLPVDNPEQSVFRTMFTQALTPASEAAEPSREQHDHIRLPDQILADMRNIDGLGG